MDTLPAQSPLPDLFPEDSARLGRLLTLSEDLTKLSQETGLNLLSVYQWHARPDIQAYIRHHRSEQAYLQTQEALKVLETIAKTSDDPIEQRRAANAILRITGAAPEHASKDQDQETRSSVPRGSFLTTAPVPHKPALEEALELLAQLNGGLVQDQDGDEDDEDPPPVPPTLSSKSVSSASDTNTVPPTVSSRSVSSAPGDDDDEDGDLDETLSAALGAPEPRAQDPGRSSSQTSLIFPPHIAKPEPGRSPHELSSIILDALERPGHPNKGDGFLTLYSLSLRPAPPTHEELERGITALKTLLPAAIGHDSAQTGELLIQGDQAVQQVIFTHKHHPPVTATVVLINAPIKTPGDPAQDPRPRAWHLLSIQRAGP